ncbi:MRG family protein [Corchorus olitorius]|uniref:MRG family protein n=1 Tax=Corchorus olitorius TaxID=93759 RepID=A0A1R3KJZ1_9ROSI|nr:MRG family protein [Corchorus olitorius]
MSGFETTPCSYRSNNSRWDEWVGIDRLMKDTEENRQKQEALGKKLEEENKTELRPTKRGTGRVFHHKLRHPKGSRGKRRKSDSSNKEKSTVPSEKLVNVQIPLTLKKQLVDDFEFVTHLGKLVKLPRSPNVEDIVKMYLEYRSKKDGMVTDSVQEIVKGIRAYFNRALPMMLLYKNERQQYEDTVTDNIRPSTVYGAEHLLRLFVKLPELLVRADIEEETLLELQQELVDFLKFLQKNQNSLFLSTYHIAEDVETSTNEQKH